MSNWISVKDRLPDNANEVIVYTPQGSTVAVFDVGSWFEVTTGWSLDDEITHWLPIPEMPS